MMMSEGDLSSAVIYGNLEDVKNELLRPGVDVNVSDYAGFTPLHYAAQEYKPDVVRLLVEAGADIDATNRYGNTPLWVATAKCRGEGDIIRYLLSVGSDPNIKNSNGVSPLGAAKMIANIDVLQFYS